MSSSFAIEAHGLTKRLGDNAAIRNLSLQVPEGAIYGLIGPNGSGKTTTLRVLLGLLAPDEGNSTIFGEDSQRMSKACRQQIGYLSEEPYPYDMVFTDCLEFSSRFFPVWDWAWCKYLIERLEVDANKKLSEMSLGQRRVAELLLAVAHKPRLLVLDDPAVGLDAIVRQEILWTLLEAAQEEGTTVVFSSHILQDVERIVDHIGILKGNRLKVSGPIEAVKDCTRRLIFSGETAPKTIAGEMSRETIGADVVVVTTKFSKALLADHPGVMVEHMNIGEIFVATSTKRKKMRWQAGQA